MKPKKTINKYLVMIKEPKLELEFFNKKTRDAFVVWARKKGYSVSVSAPFIHTLGR